MIEKQREIATLEISGDRVIIRERVAIVEDGEELTHSFEHREIGPDDDYSKESAKIKAAVEAARL
jgi:DNA-binding protein H-NS